MFFMFIDVEVCFVLCYVFIEINGYLVWFWFFVIMYMVVFVLEFVFIVIEVVNGLVFRVYVEELLIFIIDVLIEV